MSERGGELVAADEPAVDTKPLLDAIVVEDGESEGRLSDSANADKSKWSEVFCQADELLDQLVSSEEIPWWRWRWFSGCARCKYSKT